MPGTESKLLQANTPGKQKNCPQLGLSANGNVQIQSLYELEPAKRGFVKAAVSRAVRYDESVRSESFDCM